MNQSTQRILFSVMTVIFLLTACAPAAAPAAATQDPALVQQLIEQSVALTVAAQNAQTLEAQALIPPATNTPLPTQTEVAPAPSLPTATPFVIVPPTVAPVTSGGSGGSVTVKPEYACNVIDQQPADNSTWKKKKEFDINWTIVNTGTKTWSKGLDFKYYSGPQMTKVTFVEIPVAVKPGESYKVVLDAAAPDQSGFQVMTWSIEGNFCFPYVAINVE